MGKEILAQQEERGWGSKVIQRLAKDLKREFPDMRGFSRSNLMYVRAFAQAWPDEQIIQEVRGQKKKRQQVNDKQVKLIGLNA